MTLESIVFEFNRYKTLAERALSQLPDEFLNTKISENSTSISTNIRHIAGNLKSRYTDFLVEGVDGEKDWRNRDGEFVETELGREELIKEWEEGFSCLERTLEKLSDDDFSRTVIIRGQQLRVDAALHRSLSHFTYHVGQIVYLCRHFCQDSWRGLTVLSQKPGCDDDSAQSVKW